MVDPVYKPFVDRIIEACYTINVGGPTATEGESPQTDEEEEMTGDKE